MENKKLKDLTVRTASGVVLALLFVGALIWSKWSAGALFAVIMLGGLVEFYRLCRKKSVKPMYSVGIATSLAIFGLAFTVFAQWGTPATDTTARVVLGALLYTMLIIPTTFVCELWRKSPTPIANIATTFMGVIYVALWRKSISSRGNSHCQGLRTGMYLEWLVNSKEASVPAGWQSRKR